MKFNREKFTLNRDFIYKNQRIQLTEEGKSKIRRYKKLTGSRLGSLFGADAFASPFKLWCELLSMYEEEPNRYFLDAGRIIEPKLKAHAELKTGKRWRSYNAAEIKFDLFPEDDIFGGIPDGEEFNDRNEVVSILEIKTAQFDKYRWVFKNNQFVLEEKHRKPIVKIPGGGLAKWFKGGELTIPLSYRYQLSLYLYLRRIRKGYFCVAFMQTRDYDDPRAVKFISEFNNYRGFAAATEKVPQLSPREHLLVFEEFTVDLEAFKESIDFARKWYEDHVLTGISPVLTPKDLHWFRYGYPSIK